MMTTSLNRKELTFFWVMALIAIGFDVSGVAANDLNKELNQDRFELSLKERLDLIHEKDAYQAKAREIEAKFWSLNKENEYHKSEAANLRAYLEKWMDGCGLAQKAAGNPKLPPDLYNWEIPYFLVTHKVPEPRLNPPDRMSK